MTRLWLCVAFLATFSNFLSAKYQDSDEWSYQVYIGSPATMYCNDSQTYIEPDKTIQWRIPDKDLLLNSTYSDDKYKVTEKYGVPGMGLTINDVQSSDPTTYICEILMDGKVIDTNLKLLNYDGPIYLDPFDEYRFEMIVGCVAAAAFFVVVVGMCIVFKYRFRTPESKLKKQYAGEVNNGYSGSKDTGMSEYPGVVSASEKKGDDTTRL